MSVRKKIIAELESHRGEYISGEQLAEKLSVTRAAVCKIIGQLKKDGFLIDAVTNKGYSLLKESDVLTQEGILSWLVKEDELPILHVCKETGSTNNDAKQGATEENNQTQVYVAERQTLGRGRRGRSFVSFNGRGIYMSILMHPKTEQDDLVYVTTGACVGVMRAIKKVTGKTTLIKWVNDLYYEGKKVCGILTEAVTDCESGQIGSIIIGIGINFLADDNDIPEELRDIACALYQKDTEGHTRNELVAAVIREVTAIVGNLKDRSFLTEYKEASMVIGKKINVIKTDGSKIAKAMSINDTGALVVCYEDGSTEALNTGEITVRLNQE